MLQLSPGALIYLRQVQRAAAERDERRRARAAKPTRRLKKQRFMTLVRGASRILSTGRASLFEFEGACRSGLRASLCDEGWRWSEADATASAVVAAALRDLGAKRPSWDEGQLDYALRYGSQRIFCAHCGRRIPSDRTARAGVPVKYCSQECGQYAYGLKQRRSGERVSLAEYLARCASRSTRILEERARNCDHCGRMYLSAKLEKRFCSMACYKAAKVIHHPTPCKQCGTLFQPTNSGPVGGVSKYCSRTCFGMAQKAGNPRPELVCVSCLTAFRPKYPSDKRKFCSRACNLGSVIGRRRRHLLAEAVDEETSYRIADGKDPPIASS